MYLSYTGNKASYSNPTVTVYTRNSNVLDLDHPPRLHTCALPLASGAVVTRVININTALGIIQQRAVTTGLYIYCTVRITHSHTYSSQHTGGSASLNTEIFLVLSTRIEVLRARTPPIGGARSATGFTSDAKWGENERLYLNSVCSTTTARSPPTGRTFGLK